MTTHSQSESTKKVSDKLAKRGVGRPKKSHLQGEELKQHVIAVGSELYGEFGYRSLSVAKIIDAAGISRPLFYRLFSGVDEVVGVVIQRANEELLSVTSGSRHDDDDLIDVINRNIEAYFDWCRSYGPVVGTIYREINDPDSPAHRYRKWFFDQTYEAINDVSVKTGIGPLPRVLVESIVNVIEYAGSYSFWPRALSECEIEQNKKIAMRVALSTVANEHQLDRVPCLSDVLA